MVQIQEEYKYLQSLDDPQIRLHYTKLEPQGVQIIANVAMFHGFAEYSGRLQEWASKIAVQGYRIHMIDFRGYGYSGGKRFVNTAQEYHKDVHVLLQQVPKGEPLIVYGHSMGGSLLCSYLINNPGLKLAGIVFSSPMLNLKKQLTWPEQIVIMNFNFSIQQNLAYSGINPSTLTRDNDFLLQAIEDRKMYPLLTSKKIKDMYCIPKYVQQHKSKFKYNYVFAFHGEEDQIVGLKGTQDFINGIPGLIKELYVAKGGYHECHLDSDRELVFQKMMN